METETMHVIYFLILLYPCRKQVCRCVGVFSFILTRGRCVCVCVCVTVQVFSIFWKQILLCFHQLLFGLKIFHVIPALSFFFKASKSFIFSVSALLM